MQEHKNDKTCTGEQYSLFVVRHVGTARLNSLDWLDKVERVESRRAKWNLGHSGSDTGIADDIQLVTDTDRRCYVQPPLRGDFFRCKIKFVQLKC